jgi:hypothetical protein
MISSRLRWTLFWPMDRPLCLDGLLWKWASAKATQAHAPVALPPAMCAGSSCRSRLVNLKAFMVKLLTALKLSRVKFSSRMLWNYFPFQATFAQCEMFRLFKPSGNLLLMISVHQNILQLIFSNCRYGMFFWTVTVRQKAPQQIFILKKRVNRYKLCTKENRTGKPYIQKKP